MAKFEHVLPAFRDGKKVRRASWSHGAFVASFHSVGARDLLENDWEVVAEPLTDEELVAEFERRARRIRDGMYPHEVCGDEPARIVIDVETWAGAYDVCARLLRERKL